ncbi:hypothetical protein [Pararhizobium sp.]|uniref:hypothetical protein n=1 Tax=Pararhizobium sp. TaxID=1977563 RepID=UPI002718160F|nr:hypothetical protein [Pararhizobium sp.]MDO9416983.1 hypothetical protein [Pararhizobium sp.]
MTTISQAAIEAAAIADADFAGKPFNTLGRADRDRHMRRSELCLTAALPHLLPVSGDVAGVVEPRAWFVKDFADGFIHFDNEADALREVNATQALMFTGFLPSDITAFSAKLAEAEREREISNEQKEIILLRIIDGMGGTTESSDHSWNWINWFCSDEVNNVHSDTFNRCHEKGWLITGHETSFDTSTTELTKEGRDILAARAALTKETGQ